MDQPKVLTAQEAVVATPVAAVINDKSTVSDVQAALLQKGFVDGGPADGNLGPDTKDSILAFRARNNLPLVPVIDATLIKTLATAPAKAIDPGQAAATPAEIAQSVAAVAVTAEVKTQSWWSKLWAAIIAVPSIAFSILSEAINHIGDATNTVAPVRSLFAEVPFQWYLLGFGCIAGVMGYQSYRIGKLSEQAHKALVDGYRIGTVKDDIPDDLRHDRDHDGRH